MVMSNSYPTVSIVIGIYNGETKIADCLTSLLAQNYPKDRFDIIVVENGSTDRTTEIVQQFPVKLVHNEARGLAPARNLGVSLSSAEIIATTDDDCTAPPDWLYELTRPFADPEVGGAGGQILAYRHPERTPVEQFSEEHSPLVNYISGSHEFLPHLCGAHAAYRRELILRIGGFNPKMLTGEDIDISWRIQLETGKRIVYTPKAVIYHRHRSTRLGLARLYRHYGLGEILLDTMYRHYSGYPRGLKVQFKRFVQQSIAILVYIRAIIYRSMLFRLGKIDEYKYQEPRLSLLVEYNNLSGKIKAIRLTRWMKDPLPILDMDRSKLIKELYG
jgi:cellulose synthase/poly-beta-1,6-N-acetylglucosamine synthase-like glycosyltransferase